MYKIILATIFSAILALFPATAGAPATGGDTFDLSKTRLTSIVIPTGVEESVQQILPIRQAQGKLAQDDKEVKAGMTNRRTSNDSNAELNLIMPLAGPSIHKNYFGKADEFHWKDKNSGEYHVYGVANGQFIYQPSDTWFIYGLFGPIEATKYDWNVEYALWDGNHNGIDFATAIGTPVLSASGGEVIFTGVSAGNTIVIKQNNFHITYVHLDLIIVEVGESVAQGQIVGYTGNSGTVNPHLHFQIDKYKLDGSRWGINPAKYLPQLDLAIIPDVPANQIDNQIQEFSW